MIGIKIQVRRYKTKDEGLLFTLLKREGHEWEDYWKNANKEKYKKALKNSVTYLLFKEDELCGYARCRHDDGYGLYIYDLLVDKKHRGNGYGRMLMEKAASDFPDEPTYVMSDVDEYYEKLGYEKEGSIMIVNRGI